MAESDRYQVGEYWLSKQARSENWCRTWYDHRTRQTKRASLRTTDFEAAKQALNDWFILQHQKKQENPNETLMADLFARYYEHYGKNLKSEHLVRLSLAYWLDFYGGKTVAEASDVVEQEKFHNWLIHTKELKPNSANRIVQYGKAAISWAWKRGEIQHLPHFLPVKNIGVVPPRGRPLEVREVANLLKHAHAPHLRHFIIMMIATAARPDAILDLTFDRCDFEAGLIVLNPKDCAQTKKYRPTVKMPDSIVPTLQSLRENADSHYVVSYKGRKVGNTKTAWKRPLHNIWIPTFYDFCYFLHIFRICF